MDEGNKKNVIFEWLKKNHFNIIFALIFGIGGYLLWSNTRPKEPQAIRKLINAIKDNTKAVTILQKTTDNPNNIEGKKYKTNIPNITNPSVEYSVMNDNEISQTKDAPNFYTIRLDDFENALKAVALVSRQEATEDYHKSFSIFVAMLAIFGIGFPAFVAFLQHSFNEKQLEKIETTNEAVEGSKKQANAALEQANNSLNENVKLKKEILDITQTIFDEISSLYYVVYLSFIALNNCSNARVTLFVNSVLYEIKNFEIKIRNNVLDENTIKELLNNISINDLLKKINTLSNNTTEIFSLKNTCDNLNDLFIEYLETLDKIKNNLPKKLHANIDIMQKNVQKLIGIVANKAIVSDSSNNNESAHSEKSKSNQDNDNTSDQNEN